LFKGVVKLVIFISRLTLVRVGTCVCASVGE